jgi:imidazolonepropionase-like amidohydrolase/Tol biopolymer transport system component
MRISILLPLSVLLAAPAAAAAPPWEVDRHRGPTVDLQFDATEGTWISVDVSPDGSTLAFDLLGHLYTVPIEGGTALPLTFGKTWNAFPRYSPDGEELLYTSDRGGNEDLWVMTLATGESVNVTDWDRPVYQGTWSPDARHVYGTSFDMELHSSGYRFNRHGTRQELLGYDNRFVIALLTPSPAEPALYFEHQAKNYPESGSILQRYDLETAEVTRVVDRPGGAGNPALSPDGRYLAYVHRDDKENVLVVRDLESSAERVLVRGLDRGRLESRHFYGVYPNMDWHPDGNSLVYSTGGGIRRVDVATGAVTEIPFRAPVRRKLDRTFRFRGEVPVDRATTRSHRWGVPLPGGGVLFEALGDLHVLGPDGVRRNLTADARHETNPIVDPVTRTVYFAGWDDASWGAVYALPLDGGEPRRLTTVPSQYGSLALSPDGSKLAYLRGDGSLHDGRHLETQDTFELHVLDPAAGEETFVAPVDWHWNRYLRRPPSVRFGPDGATLYYTEVVDHALVLKRIRTDGLAERTLVTFPHATRAVLSPDLRWIAFREYHRTFVTPFEFAGEPYEVSAADDKGFTARVDERWDGDFTEWTAESDGLYWTRGPWFCTKPLDAVVAGTGEAERTDLSFSYDVYKENRTTVFTGVRVLTMNATLDVLENAVVVVEGDRIAGVGPDAAIPPGARVLDLSGATLMPGMLDAHGHYGSPISALNVIERRHYGLHANLAYGVTTMVDVYGTTQKDFWVGDMVRAGKMTGPRILSVGDPIFVTKYRKKLYRSIESLEDALEHARFNRDHGAPVLKDYSNHTRAARQQLAAACRELELNLVTESFGTPIMNYTQLIDGFTGIEHTLGITPIYDDVVRLFAATDVAMTPTLIVVYGGTQGEHYFLQTERLWEDPKLLKFYRRDELFRLRRPTHHFEDDFYHRDMASELRKLQDAGVILTMGAHGQKMGLGAHWEMEMFVHGGFSPLEAIRIATINGFRHHGLDHVLGSIEPGKLADLVVLDADPLEDIRNTRRVRYVMRNGVLHEGADASTPGEPYEPFYFMTGPRR